MRAVPTMSAYGRHESAVGAYPFLTTLFPHRSPQAQAMKKSFGSQPLHSGMLGAVAAPPLVPGRDVVRSRTLDNGLRVIVWPVHDIPNVALYNWVRAG